MFRRMTRQSPAALAKLLHSISRRVVRHLQRQGLLIEADEQTYLELDAQGVFEQLLGHAITYRIALGPNPG